MYDMRFNWLKCREAQQLFEFIWKKDKDNKADYHTKYHPAIHHQDKRGDYLAAPGLQLKFIQWRYIFLKRCAILLI